jgi:hypothetical protein
MELATTRRDAFALVDSGPVERFWAGRTHRGGRVPDRRMNQILAPPILGVKDVFLLH